MKTIAIDIGNSTIGFAFLRRGEPERVARIENEPGSELTRVKMENFFRTLAETHPIGRVVVCSVVPDALRRLQRRVRKFWNQDALVVGRDLKVPMVNEYRRPAQVGMDRLVCAYAARELYGAPAVVVDSGTAITFDAVSASGNYLGGAIVPGLRLSTEALFEKTALLPRARIEEPGCLIGRSTTESIQSGLFHGYGALCDGMVRRFARELGGRPKVIMTGGYAAQLRRFMVHKVHALDDGLVYKGIGLLVPDA